MELDSFLEKIPNRKFYQSEFYKEYQKGLSLFWNTDYKKCVNHVVDSIVHYADHIHIQLFYRLWLEALAKQNDTASLKLLCEHLTNVAQMSHEHVIWFSLRGLVYFELDELEACALMLKGLDGVDHQYALELQQKYSSRFVSEQRNSLELLSTAQPVIDYFSLRMLADSLLVEGQIAQLWKLLDKVDQVFPHSPIKKEFQFYRDLDKRDMVGALHVIKSLSSDFSTNSEYKFNYAYCLLSRDKSLQALRVLDELNTDKSYVKDPDVLSLKAYAMLRLSEDNPKSSYWKQAQNTFILAKEELQKNGCPCSEVSLNLNYMERRANPQDLNKISFSSWLVQLSAKRSVELSTCKEEDSEYLFRASHPSIKKHDLVFFSSQQSIGGGVIAIYRVVENSVWHPTEKNHCILELVQRFSQKITMDHISSQSPAVERLSDKQVRAFVESAKEYYPTIQDQMKSPQPQAFEHFLEVRRVS